MTSIKAQIPSMKKTMAKQLLESRDLKTESTRKDVMVRLERRLIEDIFYEGPLRECLRARRFRASLLLHTTCVRS